MEPSEVLSCEGRVPKGHMLSICHDYELTHLGKLLFESGVI